MEVTHNTNTPELLTTTQVAQALHTSPAGLDRMRRRGTSPPWLKIGNRVFYRKDRFTAWIDAQEQHQTQPPMTGPAT